MPKAEIDFKRIIVLARKQESITALEVREFITLTKQLFDRILLKEGYEKRKITALTTKFRDAGRRSAPWKPTSSRVPGRPQDGSDGNRINRWLLPKEHKFYADEKTATLVEIKYYFEALSMENAPQLNNKELEDSLVWLLGHRVEPGIYKDPIQLIPIDFTKVIANPRIIQSGHLIPLDRADRGGRHVPTNTFLMLQESNDLQGNLTLEELLAYIKKIIESHEKLKINHEDKT